MSRLISNKMLRCNLTKQLGTSGLIFMGVLTASLPYTTTVWADYKVEGDDSETTEEANPALERVRQLEAAILKVNVETGEEDSGSNPDTKTVLSDFRKMAKDSKVLAAEEAGKKAAVAMLLAEQNRLGDKLETAKKEEESARKEAVGFRRGVYNLMTGSSRAPHAGDTYARKQEEAARVRKDYDTVKKKAAAAENALNLVRAKQRDLNVSKVEFLHLHNESLTESNIKKWPAMVGESANLHAGVPNGNSPRLDQFRAQGGVGQPKLFTVPEFRLPAQGQKEIIARANELSAQVDELHGKLYALAQQRQHLLSLTVISPQEQAQIQQLNAQIDGLMSKKSAMLIEMGKLEQEYSQISTVLAAHAPADQGPTFNGLNPELGIGADLDGPELRRQAATLPGVIPQVFKNTRKSVQFDNELPFGTYEEDLEAEGGEDLLASKPPKKVKFIEGVDPTCAVSEPQTPVVPGNLGQLLSTLFAGDEFRDLPRDKVEKVISALTELFQGHVATPQAQVRTEADRKRDVALGAYIMAISSTPDVIGHLFRKNLKPEGPSPQDEETDEQVGKKILKIGKEKGIENLGRVLHETVDIVPVWDTEAVANAKKLVESGYKDTQNKKVVLNTDEKKFIAESIQHYDSGTKIFEQNAVQIVARGNKIQPSRGDEFVEVKLRDGTHQVMPIKDMSLNPGFTILAEPALQFKHKVTVLRNGKQEELSKADWRKLKADQDQAQTRRMLKRIINKSKPRPQPAPKPAVVFAAKPAVIDIPVEKAGGGPLLDSPELGVPVQVDNKVKRPPPPAGWAAHILGDWVAGTPVDYPPKAKVQAKPPVVKAAEEKQKETVPMQARPKATLEWAQEVLGAAPRNPASQNKGTGQDVNPPSQVPEKPSLERNVTTQVLSPEDAKPIQLKQAGLPPRKAPPPPVAPKAKSEKSTEAPPSLERNVTTQVLSPEDAKPIQTKTSFDRAEERQAAKKKAPLKLSIIIPESPGSEIESPRSGKNTTLKGENPQDGTVIQSKPSIDMSSPVQKKQGWIPLPGFFGGKAKEKPKRVIKRMGSIEYTEIENQENAKPNLMKGTSFSTDPNDGHH